MRKKLFIITALALSLCCLGVLAGCGNKPKIENPDEIVNAVDDPTAAQQNTAAETTTLPTVDKLQIKDIKKGTGKKAETGDNLSVVYKGMFTDGKTFDSNSKDNPFKFQLGTGEVIEGWDQGMQGMQVGGKRKLTIPASLGYGDQPNGTIPGGSTLVFEVELLSVN